MKLLGLIVVAFGLRDRRLQAAETLAVPLPASGLT